MALPHENTSVYLPTLSAILYIYIEQLHFVMDSGKSDAIHNSPERKKLQNIIGLIALKRKGEF